MKSHKALALPLLPLLFVAALATRPALANDADPAADFVSLLTTRGAEQQQALARIEQSWESSYVPMMLEVMSLSRNPEQRVQFGRTLQEKSGQSLGQGLNTWFKWLWGQKDRVDHPDYPRFKSELYRLLDPKFGGYFDADRATTIRLDEVRWGGVAQDGIPPLRQPKMLPARAATYMADDNVVFGIEVEGDARAYPKRILAWHEMFVDTVGGIEVAGVYCTLCGSVILYETTVDGTNHEMGTSGFLFRSNKLMYDKATQSLWNTLWGRPVIGPLVGRGLRLPKRSVVTTTWGEWRKRHPDTTVLSISTGYERDYSEGAAYREYFATDRLMFNTPELDERLKNKDEVLSLVFEEHSQDSLAIHVKFLRKNRVYHDSLGDLEFVVLTDKSGASRVYNSAGRRFSKFKGDDKVIDADGESWTLSESGLENAAGDKLERLAAHRTFWFGWYAAYPQTRLVK